MSAPCICRFPDPQPKEGEEHPICAKCGYPWVEAWGSYPNEKPLENLKVTISLDPAFKKQLSVFEQECEKERLCWEAVQVGDWVHVAKKDRSFGNVPFDRTGTVNRVEEARPPYIPRKVYVHGHLVDMHTWELRRHEPQIKPFVLTPAQEEEEREVRRIMDLEAAAEEEV